MKGRAVQRRAKRPRPAGRARQASTADEFQHRRRPGPHSRKQLLEGVGNFFKQRALSWCGGIGGNFSPRFDNPMETQSNGDKMRVSPLDVVSSFRTRFHERVAVLKRQQPSLRARDDTVLCVVALGGDDDRSPMGTVVCRYKWNPAT